MKHSKDNMELEVMRAFNSRKSDKEISMPDVEKELTRLKSNRKESTLISGQKQNMGHLSRKIAAILVVALMLTGLSYAAVRTSFFTKGWADTASSSPKEENPRAASSLNSTGQESVSIEKAEEDESTFILFQDATLDSVMMQITRYYKVEAHFTDERLRSVRLLFKWNKQHNLDEVLKRLNGFERFHIHRKENVLIVEQPQAENSER